MAFPSQGLLDSGTGTDANPIGGNWSNAFESGTTNVRRVSNHFDSDGGGVGYATAWWNAASFNADQEAYITMSVSGAGAISVAARIQNPGNTSTAAAYFCYMFQSTDKIQLWKMTAGHTYAQLGTDISQAVVDGDSVGIRVYGSAPATIEAWYKSGAGTWTLVGSRTDSSISGAGNIGITFDHSGFTAVDFGGGNFDSGSLVRAAPPMISF